MWTRVLLVGTILGAIALMFAFGLDRYLSFEALREGRGDLLALHARDPALFTGAFMLAQVLALALSLPGAVVIFALAAGAVFGTVTGTIVVLIAITIGDSLGFLIARYLLRDWVRRRFGDRLAGVQRGFDRHGGYYLLALRMAAVVPYFVVNFTVAMTRMRLRLFAPVSFIGLAPATLLHVNAGTQLSRIESPADILSFWMILSFVLLAVVPIALRLATVRFMPGGRATVVEAERESRAG